MIIVNSGLHMDEHVDYLPKDRTNITVLSEAVPMTPQNDLAVQSAVLGRAKAFVGTYGGMAALAQRFGVPVISVYDEWHSTVIANKDLSEFLALQTRVPFHVLRLGDLPRLQAALPHVAFG